jgi:hypothetical protein
MDMDRATAVASGFFQSIQIVSKYMEDRSNLIDGVMVSGETPHRDQALRGLWYRARGWMQTLRKLDHPRDVQAISIANRALLEITVDVLLVHEDRTNKAAWRLCCWAHSERMKAAEQVVEFYTQNGVPVPEEYQPLEESYRNEKSLTEYQRRMLWPRKSDPSKGRHPRRWSGRGNLLEDIEEVDRLYGASIQADLGSSLTEFYKTEYRRMNWQIHSGVAGFWAIPPASLALTCGLALKWCADLAMLCTKTVLSDFGFETALGGLAEEWERIRLQRDLAYLHVAGDLGEEPRLDCNEP